MYINYVLCSVTASRMIDSVNLHPVIGVCSASFLCITFALTCFDPGRALYSMKLPTFLLQFPYGKLCILCSCPECDWLPW